MIPEFDADGDIPPGIYLATLAEVEQRYSRFNVSDRRVKLFARLTQILNLARASGIVERVFIGGSFITEKTVRAATSSVEPTLEFFQSTRNNKTVGLVEVKL